VSELRGAYDPLTSDTPLPRVARVGFRSVALTDDQKAMLRLLAQRGEEGYEDMAALMGISVEEVRERVKVALAEAAGERETAALSTSEPSPAPAVAPAAAQDPPSPPQPEPSASAPPANTPASRRTTRPAVPSLRLPKDRGALIGLGAGVLVLIALAIVLAVSGDSSGSGTGATAAGSSEGTSTTAAESSLTEAILTPTNGGEGSGKALFGRYKKNVLLQVEATGLEPSPQGKAYTIWLYRSPKIALQIGAVPVSNSGKIAAQFKIPAQLLAYVASGAFNQVDVALTDTAEYKAALEKAKGEKKLPPYTGESVLRGEITGPAIR
jgi:DNA-binding Lrp family transcriptional regulator